jgi:hypothetical protein
MALAVAGAALVDETGRAFGVTSWAWMPSWSPLRERPKHIDEMSGGVVGSLVPDRGY